MSIINVPMLYSHFWSQNNERTLASMESHKDRPSGFTITAAELATSDGSQSSPRLVYKELVCNSSALCKLLSKSCKLRTSKSAQLHRVYPFVSFQKTGRGSSPHCLRLLNLSPPQPGCTQRLCRWHLRSFCFPDAGARSFQLPSMTLFLRRGKKKSHAHGEVRQIPHYFTSGGSLSFHCNLLCFHSYSFFLEDQQSRHWRNGCASSCDAQSHREMFQAAIRGTGQMKP